MAEDVKKTKKGKKAKKVSSKVDPVKTVVAEIVESEKPAVAETKSIAPADPLAAYLAEIAKYDLLTKEEEHELAVRYRETGDAEAAEKLVTSNLRFVVKVAAEYAKFGSKMIDLVQEGNIGLMHSVREFNPYKGVRLITYAVWWIRGYIQEYLMKQHSMVKIGTTQNQRKLFYQLQKQKKELEAMGEFPDYALLSSKMGIPEKEIREMNTRLNHRDISLDYQVDGDSGRTLLDVQTDSEAPDFEQALGTHEELSILRQQIEALRPQLSEREIDLLDNRILSDTPLKLQEIGDKYGVTREAVRQMENRLIKKIKSGFQEAANNDQN